MKRLFVILCIALVLVMGVSKLPSRAEKRDIDSDNDYGTYNYDNDYDYNYSDDSYLSDVSDSDGEILGTIVTIIGSLIVAGMIIFAAYTTAKKGNSRFLRREAGEPDPEDDEE